MPMGVISNDIFILISGYFNIEKEIKIEKVGKKLLTQLAVATMSLTVASTSLHLLKKDSTLSLIGVNSFNSSSWFVGYYFAIILLTYIFLNRYLLSLTKEKHTKFLIIMFAVISFSYITRILSSINGLDILITGVFLYSFGGYIRIYNPFKEVKTSVFIGIIILVNILIALSNYNVTETNIMNYLNGGCQGNFTQTAIGYNNNSVEVIIIAVCIFEIFARMKINYNKIINFLGSATFMVYLMHDNEFYYSIWAKEDFVAKLYNSIPRFLVSYLFWIVLTYMSGVFMYILFNAFIKVWRGNKMNVSEASK